MFLVSDDREMEHLESKPGVTEINDEDCSKGKETDRSKPSWAICATAAGSMFEGEGETRAWES